MRRLSCTWFHSPPVWFAAKFNIYTIGLTVLWTIIDTVGLQQRVSDIVSLNFRDTALGMISFVGIGVAVFSQPVAGRISDKAPLADRRRPFIVSATVLDLIFLVFFWLAPGYFLLFVAYILLQLSSNLGQAAFQALIPDLVKPSERGQASGVKNSYDLLASLLAVGGVVVLLQFGFGQGTILLFIAAILIVVTTLSLFWVPRVPPLPPKEQAKSLRELLNPRSIFEVFRLDFRAHRDFTLVTVSRFLFLFGLYAVQRFFLYFAQHQYATVGQGGTQIYYFLILILISAAAAAGSGVLSDRFGRKNVLRMGIVFAAVGLLGVTFSPSLLILLAPGVVLAIGIGTFQAVNWAMLSEFIPPGQEARFYGLSNIATAGASAFAGLFGPLISLLSVVQPDHNYQIAFMVTAMLVLASLIPLHLIRRSTEEISGVRTT